MVTSKEFDERLAPSLKRLHLSTRLLERVAGISERRWWSPGTHFEDAAAQAGAKALAESGIEPSQIGLLINTSVSRRNLEPSVAVKIQAEEEGLDQVFLDAGAEWRGAGCSMCLGMNPDQLKPGERSASTSNRNFQGRQGKGGRTHLVSPAVAAATALTGHLTAPADLSELEKVGV